MVGPSSADMAFCHRPSGRRGVSQHSPSVLNQEIVTDTRKRVEQPTHLIPNNENVKNARTDHSRGPAPAATSIGPRARSPHPPGGSARSIMIPAPVRLTSEANRWCIRLSNIMQRGCDRINPFVAAGYLEREDRGPVGAVGSPMKLHSPQRT